MGATEDASRTRSAGESLHTGSVPRTDQRVPRPRGPYLLRMHSILLFFRMSACHAAQELLVSLCAVSSTVHSMCRPECSFTVRRPCLPPVGMYPAARLCCCNAARRTLLKVQKHGAQYLAPHHAARLRQRQRGVLPRSTRRYSAGSRGPLSR